MSEKQYLERKNEIQEWAVRQAELFLSCSYRCGMTQKEHEAHTKQLLELMWKAYEYGFSQGAGS